MPGKLSSGTDDFGTRAIAQGQGENHPITGSSSGTRFLDHSTGNGMQNGDIADSIKADIFLTHASDLLAEIEAQDAHEHIDFRTGTVEVFRRECKQGERWNTEAAACGNDLINRLHSRTMAGITWQIAPLCPTAIAIHDNSQMSGQF